MNRSASAALVNVSLCLDNLYDTSDSLSFSPLFFAGVVISLFSSAFTNLGANVQKLALNREARRPVAEQRAMYCIPLWLAGFCLFIGAQSGDALALRLAPQSVVQPAGSVALLANMYFGHCSYLALGSPDEMLERCETRSSCQRCNSLR